jgi:hypothetical protein
MKNLNKEWEEIKANEKSDKYWKQTKTIQHTNNSSLWREKLKQKKGN